MIHRHTVRRSVLVSLSLVALGACAQTATSRANQSPGASRSAREGVGVMDKCQANEALVVENKTPYAARVIATDGGPNSFLGSQTLLEVVPSGHVDTLARTSTGHSKISFDLEQPEMASGVKAPVSEFRARCISRM